MEFGVLGQHSVYVLFRVEVEIKIGRSTYTTSDWKKVHFCFFALRALQFWEMALFFTIT